MAWWSFCTVLAEQEPFFGKQSKAKHITVVRLHCVIAFSRSTTVAVIFAKRRSEAYACWRQPRRGSPLILDMIGSSCCHMLLRNLDRFFIFLNSETEWQYSTELRTTRKLQEFRSRPNQQSPMIHRMEVGVQKIRSNLKRGNKLLNRSPSAASKVKRSNRVTKALHHRFSHSSDFSNH